MAFLRPALLVLLFALSVSAGRPEPRKLTAIDFVVLGGGRIGDGAVIKVVDVNPLQILPHFPNLVVPPLFVPVIGALVARGQFLILLDIIENFIDGAAFFKLLEEAGPVTLFAPTDEAFFKIPVEIRAAMRAHPDALLNLIAYHFIHGVFPATELLARDSLSFKSIIDSEVIEISVKESVVLVGVGSPLATVTIADVFITEKIAVHAIDFVLVAPKFVFYSAAKLIAGEEIIGGKVVGGEEVIGGEINGGELPRKLP